MSVDYAYTPAPSPAEAVLDVPIRQDIPAYDDATAAALLADYHRDGFALMRGVLNAEECRVLREAGDAVMTGKDGDGWETNRNSAIVGVRLFETHPAFEAMLTREPFIGLAERVLGKDCHLVAMNLIRNSKALGAIDNFHVDDYLFFPLPDDVPEHDPRIQMPVFVMTFQIFLSDVLCTADGPSQYVRGTHRSGRQPNDRKAPSWNGRGIEDVYGKAGDVYIHNGQSWHRGAPIQNDTTRFIYQLSYAQRFVSQRFYPFVNYQVPAGILERADVRRRRVLGIHKHGPYG